MSCVDYKNRLPEVLFGPEKAPAALRLHIEQCSDCREELSALRSTVTLLNDWHAPEPTAYFDTRMAALLREERSAPSMGLFERMRARMLFGDRMGWRPLLVSTLALLVLVGGGTYADLMHQWHHAPQAQASATILDLQSLDRNAQVFEQMDALLQDDGSGNGSNSSAAALNP